MDPSPEKAAEEEEVAIGLLRLTVNGSERLVPELKRRANRAWQARMREVFASLVETPADTPEGLEAMADAQVGLVLAYDATGALGDLEDATDREVNDIFNRLVTVAYPLASSPVAAMTILLRSVMRETGSAPSAPGSSTSSGSPSGTSAPTPSTTPSPTGSSPSSTARRRSASSGTGASA